MTLFLFQFLLKSFFQKQFFAHITYSGRSAQSPGLSPLWAERLVPRALKKNIINNLLFYLPFFTYLLCFVVFFWRVCFRWSFECALVVLPWMCFCYRFASSFHLLCCWFTLRNLVLGKFSFCLRNLLFFSKFKSVNLFQILKFFTVRP